VTNLNLWVWASGALFATCMSGIADAQAFNKTVATGGVLNLDNLASVNPDCTSRGRTIVRVMSGPAHGSIALREGLVFSVFPGVPNCNTRKVRGVAVMYRPERNFVGADLVNLDVIYPSGNEQTRYYNVIVK
jgi:hypothetical protein